MNESTASPSPSAAPMSNSMGPAVGGGGGGPLSLARFGKDSTATLASGSDGEEKGSSHLFLRVPSSNPANQSPQPTTTVTIASDTPVITSGPGDIPSPGYSATDHHSHNHHPHRSYGGDSVPSRADRPNFDDGYDDGDDDDYDYDSLHKQGTSTAASSVLNTPVVSAAEAPNGGSISFITNKMQPAASDTADIDSDRAEHKQQSNQPAPSLAASSGMTAGPAITSVSGVNWWTPVECRKLIQSYKELDIANLYPGNRSKKTAWEDISRKLAASSIHRTPHECHIKWKNLKRAYRRHLRALMANDFEQLEKVRFPYFDELDPVVGAKERTLLYSQNHHQQQHQPQQPPPQGEDVGSDINVGQAQQQQQASRRTQQQQQQQQHRYQHHRLAHLVQNPAQLTPNTMSANANTNDGSDPEDRINGQTTFPHYHQPRQQYHNHPHYHQSQPLGNGGGGEQPLSSTVKSESNNNNNNNSGGDGTRRRSISRFVAIDPLDPLGVGPAMNISHSHGHSHNVGDPLPAKHRHSGSAQQQQQQQHHHSFDPPNALPRVRPRSSDLEDDASDADDRLEQPPTSRPRYRYSPVGDGSNGGDTNTFPMSAATNHTHLPHHHHHHHQGYGVTSQQNSAAESQWQTHYHGHRQQLQGVIQDTTSPYSTALADRLVDEYSQLRIMTHQVLNKMLQTHDRFLETMESIVRHSSFLGSTSAVATPSEIASAPPAHGASSSNATPAAAAAAANKTTTNTNITATSSSSLSLLANLNDHLPPPHRRSHHHHHFR